MSNLAYNKLELQLYLKSPLFRSEETQMPLALRTCTVGGVKSDFKGMFQDVECPLMCGDIPHTAKYAYLQSVKNTFQK